VVRRHELTDQAWAEVARCSRATAAPVASGPSIAGCSTGFCGSSPPGCPGGTCPNATALADLLRAIPPLAGRWHVAAAARPCPDPLGCGRGSRLGGGGRRHDRARPPARRWCPKRGPSDHVGLVPSRTRHWDAAGVDLRPRSVWLVMALAGRWPCWSLPASAMRAPSFSRCWTPSGCLGQGQGGPASGPRI
jgi:hypothetical protein